MNIKELEKPLDPANVTKGGQSSFGPKGDYIEGWWAIAEANRIFGFDGWSYTIELTQNGLVEGEDSKGNPQWQAAYTCVCTVTVQTESGTVIRQDVGFGSGYAKHAGDAIEGATKEAATDALKRALRSFGNPFGLALYDKSRANVQAAPATINYDQSVFLTNLAKGAGTPIGEICKWVKVEKLDQIPASKFDKIEAALNKTIEEKKQKEAA